MSTPSIQIIKSVLPSLQIMSDGSTIEVINGGAALQITDRGVRGLQGVSGDVLIINAAESIPGERIVTLNSSGLLVLASPGRSIPLGISTNAGNIGEPVTVRIAGRFQSNALALTPALLVFLAASGTLTQTPPASGFSQVVGYATDANTLILNIQSPIQIS